MLRFAFTAFNAPPRFREDYISRSQTDSVKGIFILMVFISHTNQTLLNSGYTPSSVFDKVYLGIADTFGQLMVVMFLFYSGFGCIESIKNGKMKYMRKYPRHRILSTLLNFDVAVLAFLILTPLTGIHPTVKQTLLSFTGWEAVGNSNWYIFVILICYIFTWISYKVAYISKAKNLTKSVTILTGIGLVVSWAILSFVKESWWYNTIMAYWLGAAFSIYKDKIVVAIQTRYSIYIIVLATLVCLFAALYLLPWEYRGLKHNILSCTFALIVVTFTMKYRLGNKALAWCGVHLFPIYIYQRLPALVLLNVSSSTKVFFYAYPLGYVIISLAITLLLAHFYHYWQIKL